MGLLGQKTQKAEKICENSKWKYPFCVWSVCQTTIIWEKVTFTSLLSLENKVLAAKFRTYDTLHFSRDCNEYSLIYWTKLYAIFILTHINYNCLTTIIFHIKIKIANVSIKWYTCCCTFLYFSMWTRIMVKVTYFWKNFNFWTWKMSHSNTATNFLPWHENFH